jgi:hypothetical protein
MEKLMEEILERAEVEVSDTEIPGEFLGRLNTLKEAKEVLGASSVTVEKELQELEEKVKGTQLASALNKLGISVFTKRSVERYKEQKLNMVNGPIVQKRKRKIKIGALLLLPGLCFFIWSCIIGGATGLFVSIFSLCAMVLGVSLLNFPFTWRWKKYPISHYKGFIPMSVLETAAKIKKELQDVEIYVEALEKEKKRDPFILVSYGDREYYIDVWDEPEFKG